MTGLRQCPFCGSGAVIKAFYMGTYVECGKCGCTTSRFIEEKDAIMAWNNRADTKGIESFSYGDAEVHPMTPSEFAEEMKKISETDTGYSGCDTEDNHVSMDYLMCETLRSLGYGEGVDIFENTEKWYS